jgi:purine nucleosidase
MVKPVILDHDGGIDDIIALVILLSRPQEVALVGCLVTDADCFVDDAVSVCRKLRRMFRTLAPEAARPLYFPIATSTMPAVHDFPRDWRFDAKKMDDLPSINATYSEEDDERDDAQSPGQEQLAAWVMASPEPVTICVTGPLSNVAFCLEKYGEAFARNVAEVVVMGGAVRTPGNVLPSFGTDNSAEWNFYWDAPSAKVVLQSAAVRKVIFGLDATNHVPVSSTFVKQFGRQNNYLLSQFVGSSWAMCTHFSELFGVENGYFAWDALTAAYVADPSIVTASEDLVLDVDAVKGSLSEGRSVELREAAVGDDGLLPSRVVFKVKASKFYEMVLQCCTLF